MRYVLHNVMSIPRNSFTHTDNKNDIASYLFGKFGLLGLLTHVQRIDMRNMMEFFNHLDHQVCNAIRALYSFERTKCLLLVHLSSLSRVTPGTQNIGEYQGST